MARVANNTYMQVDYPRGKTSIGYIYTVGERRVVSLRGATYSVNNLLESGYTFTPLVAVSQERVEALARYLDAYSYRDKDFGGPNPDVEAAYNVLVAMLAEMKEVGDGN